jgi:hypothetical protein
MTDTEIAGTWQGKLGDTEGTFRACPDTCECAKSGECTCEPDEEEGSDDA